MVGTAGIEPATPAMSMQCSPAELRARIGVGPYRIIAPEPLSSAANVTSCRGSNKWEMPTTFGGQEAFLPPNCSTTAAQLQQHP